MVKLERHQLTGLFMDYLVGYVNGKLGVFRHSHPIDGFLHEIPVRIVEFPLEYLRHISFHASSLRHIPEHLKLHALLGDVHLLESDVLYLNQNPIRGVVTANSANRVVVAEYLCVPRVILGYQSRNLWYHILSFQLVQLPVVPLSLLFSFGILCSRAK